MPCSWLPMLFPLLSAGIQKDHNYSMQMLCAAFKGLICFELLLNYMLEMH